MTTRIIIADVMDALAHLPNDSVHCIVTSPPYWGLRDYGVSQQIGLEPTLTAHINVLVAVFGECRRVLRPDGTCWIIYGDSYASRKTDDGLKPKDLSLAASRLAVALQDDGWWVRSEIIWHKTNSMPESVHDRPSTAHEKIFFLTKSSHYCYNAAAVSEPSRGSSRSKGSFRRASSKRAGGHIGQTMGTHRADRPDIDYCGPNRRRNLRNVWSIATRPFPATHFATFPPDLAATCIKAGCPEGGIVLDPFAGTGTTGLAADRMRRSAILIEINPRYGAIAAARIQQEAMLFADITIERRASNDSQ